MRIKVELEPGQTREEAEELLFKAIQAQKTGDIHSGEEFQDPAMEHTAQLLKQAHQQMYQEMLQEISTVLDEEYS